VAELAVVAVAQAEVAEVAMVAAGQEAVWMAQWTSWTS